MNNKFNSFRSQLKTAIVFCCLFVTASYAAVPSINILNKPGTYLTIQDALNAASPNDTIQLDAGTWDQGVTINWPNTTGLTLRGTDGTTSSNVIITGGGTHRIFDITAPISLNISGLTLQDGFVSGVNGCAFNITTSNIKLNLNNILVSGNIASNSHGGVVYCINDTSTINATYCTFMNNKAYFGGVAYNGNWLVNNSIFNGNKASNNGGVAYQGYWKANNNIFSKNSAIFGGVVYQAWLWTANNNIFVENNAAYGGVAQHTAWTANNNTFVGNNASDCGGVAYGGSLTATNNIFWNNKENNIVKNDFNSVVLKLNYCLVSTVNYQTGGSNTTTNLIIGDPRLVSEISTNTKFLQLSGNSPCIDTGTTNMGVTTDIIGTPRPKLSSYDMGAYEYNDIYLSSISPARYSRNIPLNTNISFRIRDQYNPSTNLTCGITINGVNYTNYTIATDNSTAVNTDMYIVFPEVSFSEYLTVNVTININSSGTTYQEYYNFKIIDLTPATITLISPTDNSTNNPITSKLKFIVTDNGIIIPSSLTVTINEELAITNGSSAISNYSVTYQPTLNGYIFSIERISPYTKLSINTVNIRIKDDGNNAITLNYIFTTGLPLGIRNISYDPVQEYGSIQQALNNATENQTIVLDTGIYDDGAAINWPKTTGLTLRGADGTTSASVIITGGKTHRIFEIGYSGISINISGLTIQNGFVYYSSGAAFNITSTNVLLNLNNLIVSGNATSGNNIACGGVVSCINNSSTINATLCKFINNKAAGSGGVTYYGNWIANNNTFCGNNASYSGGVAVNSNWTANSNIFSENKAFQYGGVAYDGIWIANNNPFSGNKANAYGGVAYQGYWKVNNNIFSENGGSQYGGVAYYGTWNSINNTFFGNSALYGGVAYNSMWTANNTIFWGNKERGITKNDFNNTSITLNNCAVSTINYRIGTGTTLISNIVIGNPIFISEVSSNTRFLQLNYGSPCIDTGTSNVSITTDIRGYPRPISAGFDIGAYESDCFFLSDFTPANSAKYVSINNNILVRVRNGNTPSPNINTSISVNGISYTNYSIITDNSSTVSTDMYLSFSVTLDYGSTIIIKVTSISPLNSIKSSFWFKTVPDPLTAKIHNISYTPTRDYENVSDALNDATANQIIELDTGMYDDGITINWPNTTGLTLRGADGTTSANVIISGGKSHRIFDITAPISLNISGLTLQDGFVSGNSGGGGIYCTNNTTVTINLTSIIISGNISTGNNGNGGFLGLGNNTNLKIILNDSLIKKNQASNTGGVAYSGTWTVNNCIFSENSSSSQGGIAGYSTWKVNNSTFYGNSAKAGGIGYQGTWTVNKCIFRQNGYTLSNGNGGIAFGGTWIVNSSLFDGNRSSYSGIGHASSWTVNNSIFTNNYASMGSITAFNSNVWIVNNCTFSGNSSDYGGIAYMSKWIATNSIFWNDTTESGLKKDFESCTALTLNYCSVSTTNYYANTTMIATNNLFIGNPFFASEISTNTKYLQLAYNSPCLDTGTIIASVTQDILGTARPYGSSYDMGAYEMGAFPAAPIINGITSGIISSNASMTITGEANTTINYSLNNGSTWSVYTSGINLTEGTYQVLANQTNLDGNKSAATATINLTIDTTPPAAPSININNHKIYTNTCNVSLNLSITGAEQMLVSNNTSFEGSSWITVTNNFSWILPTGDGDKIVYIKFRDAALNETAVVSDSITLDTTTPTAITSGNPTEPQNSNAIIYIFGTDSLSGMATPTISFTATHNGLYSFVLTDNAGNMINYEVNVTMIDKTGPTNTQIIINNGAAYSYNASVVLSINATNAVQMRLGDIEDLSGVAWEPYAIQKTLTLSPGYGDKTIFIEFMDTIGNISTVVSDSILLKELTAGDTHLDLTMLLHGYYNKTTGTQQPATINIELRENRDIATSLSITTTLDSNGHATGLLSNVFPGTYYVAIAQVIPGYTQGINHMTIVSSVNILFDGDGYVTTMNFSNKTSDAFIPVYVYPTAEKGGSMITLVSPNLLGLSGGDADGNDMINILDILKWDERIGRPDSDHRGAADFSEAPNFDGNEFINAQDFNVWDEANGKVAK